MRWATGGRPATIWLLKTTFTLSGGQCSLMLFQLGHPSCSGMVKAAQQEDLGVNLVPNQQISDLRSMCGMCWTSSGGRKLQKDRKKNN